MSNELISIDPTQLATVSGGKSDGGKSDPLLSQISSIASQIKDVTKATSGMSSTQMLLMFAVLANRNQANNSTVVYYRRW